MHLLRYRSREQGFELVTFNSEDAPPYAILSHTWGEEEITYDNMMNGTGKEKAGYEKIHFCGRQAARCKLEYFWVDTCCINKNSSAELSESINSMYSWYQKAVVCFAYIQDWQTKFEWADLASIIPTNDGLAPDESTADRGPRLASDALYPARRREGDLEKDSFDAVQRVYSRAGNRPLRWFTRGWTLQELIAPYNVEFYDSEQILRGRKYEKDVASQLSRITGIPSNVLLSRTGLNRTCHGQRMSWAAYRHTTRKEDIAYCLLGIFGINMPLLYGEGERAFFRLQEQILSSSTDLSLLAWTPVVQDRRQYRGIFSWHPLEFRYLKGCDLDDSQFSTQDEVIMTNKGARVKASPFLNGTIDTDGSYSYSESDICLSLGCYDNGGNLVGIHLAKFKDIFFRHRELALLAYPLSLRGDIRTLYLSRDCTNDLNDEYESSLKNDIAVILEMQYDLYLPSVEESWPPGYFDTAAWEFKVGHLEYFMGYLLIRLSNKSSQASNNPTGAIRFLAVVTRYQPMTRRMSTFLPFITVTALHANNAERLRQELGNVSGMTPKAAYEHVQKSLIQMRPNMGSRLNMHDPVNNYNLHCRWESCNVCRPKNEFSVDRDILNDVRIEFEIKPAETDRPLESDTRTSGI